MAKRKSPSDEANGHADIEANGHAEGNGAIAALPAPEQPTEPDAPVSPAEAPPRESRSNLPVHVVRFGAVRACIWVAQTDYGPRHNVTVSRLYKGGDGNWYSSNTFGYRDLLALAKCLDWAHTWIAQEIANAGEVPF